MKSSFLLALLLLGSTQPAHPKRAVTILQQDTGENTRVLLPMIAPVLYVSQTEGKPLPQKGSIQCSWQEELSKAGDRVIAGYCEGDAKVVLTGIDLNY